LLSRRRPLFPGGRKPVSMDAKGTRGESYFTCCNSILGRIELPGYRCRGPRRTIGEVNALHCPASIPGGDGE